MQISKRGWQGVLALAIVAMTAGGLTALSMDETWQQNETAAAKFASPQAAYKAGVAALTQDNMSEALSALEFAADRGVPAAQLRLARIFSRDGRYQADAKAFAYYRMLVDKFGDVDQLHPAAQYVSEAWRGLAQYHRAGIPEVGLKPDPHKAARLMRYAASYFRDPIAQFEIGKMYANGDGVARNQRLAASWLLKASQKKYAPAQAYLGEILWRANTSDQTRAQGLAMLALALENASETERGKIEARYQMVGRSAKTSVITRAEQFVATWDRLSVTQKTPGTASAHLRALRVTPFDSAPLGSLVVSHHDPLVANNVDTSFGALAMYLHDMRVDRSSNTAVAVEGPAGDDSPAKFSAPVENFFIGQPSSKGGPRADDVFATLEVDRYSGEMLSVDTELPLE